MAKTDDSDNPRRSAAAFSRGGSIRTPMGVMAGLVVVFVVGALLAVAARARRAQAAMKVFARWCCRRRTGLALSWCHPAVRGRRSTPGNVAAQIDTPGATVVQVPQAKRARVVLIPRCSASVSKAGAATSAQGPSSLFVPTTGAKTAAGTTATAGAAIKPRSQLIVPSASEAQTIVFPPCTGSGRKDRATVLVPRAGSPTASIAPRC